MVNVGLLSKMSQFNSAANIASIVMLSGAFLSCAPEKDRQHNSTPMPSQQPIAVATLPDSSWRNWAQTITEKYPEFPALVSIAIEQRRQELAGAVLSLSQAEQFSSDLLSAWRADLVLQGIDPPVANSMTTESQNLTFYSLGQGAFVAPSLNQVPGEQAQYSARIGLARVHQIRLGQSEIAKIGLGKVAIGPVEFFSIDPLDITPRITFLGFTALCSHTNAYRIIINTRALNGTVREIFRPESSTQESTLQQSLLEVMKLNELSTVVLASALKTKTSLLTSGDEDSLLISTVPDRVTLPIRSLYEAFSDLCSWREGSLPAWAHLLLLDDQLNMQSPTTYQWTFQLQTEAITAAARSIPGLEQGLTEYAATQNCESLDLKQIASFLRGHLEFESKLKRAVVLNLDRAITPTVSALFAERH